VLRRIKDIGDIFFAEADRTWVLEGASVHVSMVGFDGGSEPMRVLDGKKVVDINPNLTAIADLTTARRLPESAGLGFQGGIKRGAFDIDERTAIGFLSESGNPHARPNSDVVVPYVNGLDVTRRNRNVWIVDFGDGTPKEAAARYTAPFEYTRLNVYPERQAANQAKARDEWWLHWCARPRMNAALAGLRRFIATPRVSKYRLFTWLEVPSYADCQLIVFVRDDDYFFGILHSRPHEVWARAQGTQVRERESGFRYTPTTCFESFPLPHVTAEQSALISAAAEDLNAMRSAWLNPPEWARTKILEFPGSVDGPWGRYLVEPDNSGIGTVRWPRTVPKDPDCSASLSKRTLTRLYNECPTWLQIAHKKLDEAVFAAYGWPPDLSDEALLAKLLMLNLERSGESKDTMLTDSVRK
jgi:hypothetical protein